MKRYTITEQPVEGSFEKYRVYDNLTGECIGLRWEFHSRIRPYVDKLNSGELSREDYLALAR